MSRKLKRRESVIDNVKRLFKNSPDKSEISLEEAFVSWGRKNPKNMDLHKAWVSNLLFHLKFYGFVEAVYEHSNSRRKLVGMRLTEEGRHAIGRSSINHPSEKTSPTSLNEMTELVKKWQAENEEYEVNFDIRLKKK